MLFRTFALLSSLPCATAAWSFANFLQGDWDLEKIKDGKLTLAHYSLKTTPGGTLEGIFFEEDADGRSNEMRVEVEFDLAAPDTAGSFRVAKRKVFEADDNDDEPPVPKPAGEVEYGEFTTLFQFDFHPRNTEHFWISESKWLPGKGGTLQFMTSGHNAFIYSQVSNSGSVSTWTASRSGVDMAAAGGSAPSAPTAPTSMLQRWGKWLGAFALFLAYRFVKEKAAKLKVG